MWHLCILMALKLGIKGMKRINKQCLVCGEEFRPKSVTSVYCSPKCSKKAYKQKMKQLKNEAELKALADKIPQSRAFISVPEAGMLFGIAKRTLYRLVGQGNIRSVNLGNRLIRIERSVMEEMFGPARSLPQAESAPKKKLYSLEKEDCYSIGEIAQRFQISEGSVYSHIRKYSIPTRQIGKNVYAPKTEIDNLYNGNDFI
jgi:excisionase family DNA binding protein